MSIHSKKKDFRLSFKVIFRFTFFILIIAASIYYMSAQNALRNPNVLGTATTPASEMPIVKMIVDNLYNQLPENSRNTIENLNNSPVFTDIQNKLNYFKEVSTNFPQHQLNYIKVYILKKGSDYLKSASEK